MHISEQSTLAVLADLLGKTDALFRAIRRWDKSAQAVLEQRQVYRGLGILVPSLAGTDRAQRARDLERHERSGLIIPSGVRGQSRYWRLTSDADWQLRSICFLPGFEPMRIALAALSACERSKHDKRDNIVPEVWLMGCTYASARAKVRRRQLDEFFAPASCRGLVTCRSDCDGRLAWQTTGLPLPEKPAGDLPEFNGDLADAYIAAWAAEVDRLAAAVPAVTNAIPIPLSAGEWPSQTPPRSARRELEALWGLFNDQ